METDHGRSRAAGARIHSKRPIVRCASSLAIAAGLWGMTGCAPGIDQLVDESLANGVESAQDDLWEYREALLADMEGTISSIGFVADARPIYHDPAYVVGAGQYTLLAASSSPEGVTLTLATSGGAQTGGGWWYEQRSAAVCFELRISAKADAIYTEPSDCSNGEGHGLGDVASFARHGEPVPLDQLDVRRTVTEADYPPPICQCHSGGDCGCPGG